ncbi:MAG TPA: xanthine dehydrogenase family protein molybdopterin-binding subunit [Chloroflexota bacterium]|nr:xanthine dehydrogenase family protein molybdopterin-binding subunit [Chloroflexota bacterium]
MADQLVGQSIKRFEDDALVHGAGHYTDDFNPPGTLHLAIVRSPYPKARIVSINTEPAKAAPGVVDVITGEDVKDLGDIPIIPLPGVKAPRHPMLCQGYVAAPGAPVAAVLAETAAQAEDAAALVEAEYEPQPSVSEPEAAMAPDAPKVFDELENNVCYTVTRGSGDVDQAIAEADHVVRLRIDSPRLVALSLEPRATLAIPEGFGRGLTVYSSTQAPHGLRLALAQSLKYPENNIRVIAPDVGGGFGSKGGSYREDVLCGFLAMKHGRPVKYVATRSEDIMTTIQGRDMAVTAELAAKKDGTLTGFRINNIANMGAYLHSATALPPMFMLNMAPGCYKIPAASATAVGVFTNTTSTGPYRGAGRPEAVLAIERMVDEMAHELGMDAVELRRKNFIQPDEFPYKTAMGVTYDSGDYGKALDRALELAGYDQLLKERDERRAKGELVGIGLSTFVEPSGGLGFESGVVRMERSGRVTVVTGSSSHGQGHETVYAQIVADKLKVPIDHVKVLHGDTLGTPAGTGTFGSRSAMTGGAALVVASDRVVDKAKKVAAMMLEASPDDIELVDGGLAVAGTPDKKVPWQGVAMKAHLSPPPGEEPGLESTSYFDTRGASAWGSGTHLAVVSISRETGQVTIEKLVAVDDCGNVLNPMIVEGQVLGGLAQAIGQVLLEKVVFDSSGQTLSATLMDYAAPRAEHIPPLILDHTHTPSPTNPLGVKGVGEAGTNGCPPAVANAVIDALSPLGVKHVDMPYTAPKLWQVIQEHSA